MFNGQDHSFIYLGVRWQNYWSTSVSKVDHLWWNTELVSVKQENRGLSVNTRLCGYWVRNMCYMSAKLTSAYLTLLQVKNKGTKPGESGSWKVEAMMLGVRGQHAGDSVRLPPFYVKQTLGCRCRKRGPVPSFSLHWFLGMQSTKGADREQRWIIQAVALQRNCVDFTLKIIKWEAWKAKSPSMQVCTHMANYLVVYQACLGKVNLFFSCNLFCLS